MRSICLAVALSGCSILGTRTVAEHGAEKCTTTVFPPAVDTLTVVGAAAFATYASLELDDVDHLAIPAAVSVGLIYGISAIVGYSRATSCKRARIKEGIAY